MTPSASNNLRNLALAVLATALGGCDSGPSESEFTAACVKEGQRGVNKALSREMGINRDTFCKCTAKETKAVVSAEGYRWMMLDMEGKRPEAAALHARMNESDRTDVMKAAMMALGKCAGGMR
jgi:hypothetical protein